jgi:FtsZ-interacting cell division protein ZipA
MSLYNMNELQVALVVIGVVAVVGILIYNRVQERKFRREAEAGFSRPRRDALMDDEPSIVHQRRVEPELREPIFDLADSASAEHAGGHEPHFGSAAAGPDSAGVMADAISAKAQEAPQPAVSVVAATEAGSVEPRKAPASLPVNPTRPRSGPQAVPDPVTRPAPIASAPHDDLIEYRVRIKGEGILASVFAEAISRSRTLPKQVRWLGWPVGGHAWDEILPWSEKHYQEVLVAMQLADRNGAASEEALSGLCNLVRETASANGLKAQCDDLPEGLERARSLDMFCVDVDVLIGLNVVARGDETLPMSKVQLEASNAGMVLAADGTFQLLDSRGEVLYSLCNHESTPFSPDSLDALETHGITLLFDVPRVPDGVKTFNNMVALGRKLAHEVGGLLVDDNLRPLTDAGIDKIRAQLTQIYNKMEARGVPAGGRLALKLFS